MKMIFDKRYPVTSLLLLVTSVVFLTMLVTRGFNYTSGQTLFDFGAVYGLVIKAMPSQLWRLFTATFVHIGFEHFFMNMIALYFLGRQVEMIFGSWNFLLLYLLSGIMGNIFVLLWTPDVLAAGASTAVYGLFAAVVVLRYAVRNSYIQNLGQTYLTLLVVNLVFSLLTPGVSLAGHIGGAVGGALLAVVFPVRGEPFAYTLGQRLLAILAFLVLAIGGVGLALLF